jgi:hypothetical protein
LFIILSPRLAEYSIQPEEKRAAVLRWVHFTIVGCLEMFKEIAKTLYGVLSVAPRRNLHAKAGGRPQRAAPAGFPPDNKDVHSVTTGGLIG